MDCNPARLVMGAATEKASRKIKKKIGIINYKQRRKKGFVQPIEIFFFCKIEID